MDAAAHYRQLLQLGRDEFLAAAAPAALVRHRRDDPHSRDGSDTVTIDEHVVDETLPHTRQPDAGELEVEVYPLSKNAGLALTTQKWYTPSGRLIQRDYSQISQFDYYNHREAAPPKKDDIKHSDTGRIVYGGGGITPDYVVEEPKVNDFQANLAAKFGVYTFVRDYLAKNPAVSESTFQVSDAIIDQFKQHITKRGIQFTDQEFNDNRDYLKRAIKYEIFYDKFGVGDASRVLLEGDPQLNKALDLLPEAKELANRAHRQVAEKR